MNKHLYELLSQIKKRYIATNGYSKFQIEESGVNVSPRQFYLYRLTDNLIRQMNPRHVKEYSQGSGNELEDKMKALRSSSALTFNLLGNETCKVVHPDNTFPSNNYDVHYEFQLPTLRSGLPANLDAMLEGESGDLIACEMKMLEWLTSDPSMLKEKYLDPINYIHSDTTSVFIEAARELNESNAFTHYDFAQMFKHTLALYNAVKSGKLDSKRITLLNCVWEPPSNYELSGSTKDWLLGSTESEHAGFQEFLRIMQSVSELFDRDCNIQFAIQYIPAGELISRLSYPDDELIKINRYI